MSKDITILEGDRSSREYWNRRVLEYKDDEEVMIWATGTQFKKRYDEIITKVLSQFKDCTAIDVACGFGRFAHIFKPENYLGFDFCDEMIKLAKEKHPKYRFEVQNYYDFDVPEVDIIFNVISVGSMGVNHEMFIEKYKDKAKKAIISVDGTSIMIYPK